MASSRIEVLVSHVNPTSLLVDVEEPWPGADAPEGVSSLWWGVGEAADMAEVNVVGSTAFMVNTLRAFGGGFVPPASKLSNVSEKMAKYLGEMAEIREKHPPLYFDTMSSLLINDYSWGIWEKFVALDGFCKMDDKAIILETRTKFIDDQVTQAIAADTRQVVYLGSGLDTRAIRLYSFGVSSFEVDEEAVLNYKVKQLARAGWPAYPANLVMGNYLEIDLFAELQQAGLDLSAATIVIWEGNSMYLPINHAASLMTKLFDRIPKAVVVFDTVLGDGDEHFQRALESFYAISGGKPICEWGMDPHTFAAAVGGKLQQSISFYDLALEANGGEEIVKSRMLNNPEGLQCFKSTGMIYHANVMAKCGE